LFEEGGNIGPDLTGYQRDQTKTLLRNIVAPSLEIREGYQAWTLALSSGSVLTGFVENETDDLIVIKGIDGSSQTIEKEEIEQRKPQSLSIMPERILDALKPNEISDLLAYLRSTQPIMDQ
jgi:putative heme-binding domain-containing protein